MEGTVLAYGHGAPRLSIIICAYNMQREAPRTILSAAIPYQEDVHLSDYEVIVLDNGSATPLRVDPLPAGVTIVRVPRPRPSPVFAMNWAAREIATGANLLFAIDGARIFSKRLYAETLLALDASPDAFVFTLAWHLGPKQQKHSVREGYNQAIEDAMIARSGWPADRDALFDISTFAGSSTGGFFRGIVESNAFAMSRSLFAAHGGFDERFSGPGGGLANLEVFSRYVTRPRARNICLLSEGTFHQVHDAVTTNGKTPYEQLDRDYAAIFGDSFRRPTYRALYAGMPHPRIRRFVEQSIDGVPNDGR